VVLVGTVATQRAVALHVRLACWTIRVQAKAVFASQKVTEVEFIGGRVGLGESLVMASWPLHFCCHGVEDVMEALR
jgi:hypothetical protein